MASGHLVRDRPAYRLNALTPPNYVVNRHGYAIPPLAIVHYIVDALMALERGSTMHTLM